MGNDVPFHVYYNGKRLSRNHITYKVINIKDEKNKMVKQIYINGMDSMKTIIKRNKLEDGIPYKENYSISMWSAEPNRTGIWQNQLIRQKSTSHSVKLVKTELDNFILALKANDIKSSAANQELEALNKKLAALEQEKNKL
ncbi:MULTISPECIES: hypothetical protein [unclassified Spiroplasma]|uniref:hypothetical protein n=1 Tax=unclassified Spiroplasma TaxID=2637901 RepID=UPI0030D0AD00